GAGLVQSSSSGALSSGAVDRNSSTFFSNTLTVANGGTGQTSFIANGIVFGNGTSSLQVTSAGTQGQLLFAGASGTPGFATITGDIVSSTSTTGQLTVNSLQGKTLTIAASPTSGDLLLYNGSAFVNQAVTGDVTINGSGVTTIGAGKVTNADLQNGGFTLNNGTNVTGAPGVVNLGDTVTLGVVNNP